MVNFFPSVLIRPVPLATLFAVLFWSGSLSAQEAGARLRIAFELSSGDASALQAVIADVERLQKNSGRLSQITIIAFSEGAALLCSNNEGTGNFQGKLASLADNGVDLVVCQASLESAKLSSHDLLTFARTVKTGSQELERLETEGWARVPEGESYVSHL